MYPNPIFTGSSWCFLSVVRVSYFRAPFGVGALTTIPRAKLKKKARPKHETTAKKKKRPTNQHQTTRTTPSSETTATTTARGIVLNISSATDIPYERNAILNPTPHFSASASDSGRIFLTGVTQFITLDRTVAQKHLVYCLCLRNAIPIHMFLTLLVYHLMLCYRICERLGRLPADRNRNPPSYYFPRR